MAELLGVDNVATAAGGDIQFADIKASAKISIHASGVVSISRLDGPCIMT
jgi:hypothetical protein